MLLLLSVIQLRGQCKNIKRKSLFIYVVHVVKNRIVRFTSKINSRYNLIKQIFENQRKAPG